MLRFFFARDVKTQPALMKLWFKNANVEVESWPSFCQGWWLRNQKQKVEQKLFIAFWARAVPEQATTDGRAGRQTSPKTARKLWVDDRKWSVTVKLVSQEPSAWMDLGQAAI